MPRRQPVARLAWGSVALTLTALVGLPLTSCVALPPRNGSIPQERRLNEFPTEGLSVVAPVQIHWDEHSIPFIHADDERDVPYAMGLVHAHLRLGSMELVRKVSQGRISEMAGPFTMFLDHSIRALDIDRAVPEVEANLPNDTRLWIERYCEGINDYKRIVRSRSADFTTLGFDDEPWTVADVLTFGRLASVDINVGRWLALFPKRPELGYAEFEGRLLAFGDAGRASFGPEEPTPLSFLTDRAKSGSNAFVVAGDRSASGAGLLAADPHLGLPQPNVWCVVGYRSPAGAVVGLTIPALPFVLIGRNERIAWGGTNMQNTASVLYDVSGEELTERKEKFGVRWWFDARKTVRDSAYGPVITDGPLFDGLSAGPASILWNGHAPSDEATAFYRVSKSRDWQDFREAFATYGAGGQNFLYADAGGNIGQLLATRVHPVAGRLRLNLPADPNDPANAWGEGIPSDELPASYNPAEGFLVSANNTPVATDPPLLTQGNANDRVLRMQDVLADTPNATLGDLHALQRDVFSGASLATSRELVARFNEPDDAALTALAGELAAWDGFYDPDDRAPVIYQAWLRELIDAGYAEIYSPGLISTLRSGPYVHAFVLEDLRANRFSRETIAAALRRAAPRITADATWGDRHRFKAQHPLGNVPVIGGWFRFGEWASPGTLTSVYKAAHSVRSDEHAVTFGANSRFLADLSGPDSNYVVLLGGQDGFLGSEHLVDQVDLWFGGTGDDGLGGLVPLPLSEEGQAGRAVRTHRLSPGG